MKKLNLIIAACGLMATYTPSAVAGPNDNCHGYAMQAVSQYKQALQNKCGIGGLGWTTDYNMHRTWCELPTTSTGELGYWSQKRQAAVNGCKQAIKDLNKPKGPFVPAGSKCAQGKKEARNAGFKNVKIWKSSGIFCRLTATRQGKKYIIDTTQNSSKGAKIVNFKTY